MVGSGEETEPGLMLVCHGGGLTFQSPMAVTPVLNSLGVPTVTPHSSLSLANWIIGSGENFKLDLQSQRQS